MKRLLLLFGAVIPMLCAAPLWAASLTFPAGEFKKVSEELGAVVAYRNVAPATALGSGGFDIGVDVSAIDISSSYQIDNSSHDYLYMTRARARVGLPWGITVGGMYGWSPNTLARIYGFEVGKEILADEGVLPALGIRGTYSRLNDLDLLGMYAWGCDATVSKQLAIITPYVGLGPQWISSTYTGLPREEFWQMRYFGGVQVVPFPFLRIAGEAEYEVKWAYTLKLAIGF